MLLCTISGRPISVPVVDKHGYLFEKALVEAYIAEKGEHPVLHTPFGVADVVALRTPVVSTLSTDTGKAAGIPQTLAMLEREWTSMQLELFEARQTITSLTESNKLLTAETEAARRVIAQLLDDQERIASSITPSTSGLSLEEADEGVSDKDAFRETYAACMDTIMQMLVPARRQFRSSLQTSSITASDAVVCPVVPRCCGNVAVDSQCLIVTDRGVEVIGSDGVSSVLIRSGDIVSVVGTSENCAAFTEEAVYWFSTRDEESTLKKLSSVQPHLQAHVVWHVLGFAVMLCPVETGWKLSMFNGDVIFEMNLDLPDTPSALGIHPDALLLFIGLENGEMVVFDIANQKSIVNQALITSNLSGVTTGPITQIATSCDGSNVFVTTSSRVIRFDLQRKNLPLVLLDNVEWPSVAVSMFRRVLFVSTDKADDYIIVYNSSGEITQQKSLSLDPRATEGIFIDDGSIIAFEPDTCAHLVNVSFH